jgi:hypothetical protein
MHRPGIDLAVVLAMISSALDFVALFLPWTVGIDSQYVPGKGLTYVVTTLLSAIDLMNYNVYLVLILLAPILTVVLIIFSVRPEGIIPPRIGYKAKSRMILLSAALVSILPAYSFVNSVMLGVAAVPETRQFAGRWELGAGATIPIYAGFGFMLALGFKLIKD